MTSIQTDTTEEDLQYEAPVVSYQGPSDDERAPLLSSKFGSLYSPSGTSLTDRYYILHAGMHVILQRFVEACSRVEIYSTL